MYEKIAAMYGPVLSTLDLARFLGAVYGLGKKPAYSDAREVMGHLLTRVPEAVFICLLCETRAGICRCPSQGIRSARWPGKWVYVIRTKSWVVTRASVLALNEATMRPLSPKTRATIRAWQEHLRKMDGK